jgi:hypothetical protein
MSSPTTLLPFHPLSMSTAQLAAGTPTTCTPTSSDVGSPSAKAKELDPLVEIQLSPGIAPGGAEQALVVGVVADDAVQHDDVGLVDVLGPLGDVQRATQARDPACPTAPAGGDPGVVVGGDLEVGCPGRPAPEQLDLNRTNPAPIPGTVAPSMPARSGTTRSPAPSGSAHVGGAAWAHGARTGRRTSRRGHPARSRRP